MRNHAFIATGLKQTHDYQFDYREAVRSGESIDWRCVDCENPILNSTPLQFTDDEQQQSMVR